MSRLRDEIAALVVTADAAATPMNDTDFLILRGHNNAVRQVLAILDRIADHAREDVQTPSEERPARDNMRNALQVAHETADYPEGVSIMQTLAIVEAIDANTAAIREAKR
ncbi:MAG: hypothetical protein WCD38_11735 [Candidatus Tumulicola sp.]